MASLRNTAQCILEEARDGIAWMAFYRVGRGWEADCFWPEIDRDGTLAFEAGDEAELKGILATDRDAIFVNGYYTNLGPQEEMTRETLAAALRWQYENHYNQLANTI